MDEFPHPSGNGVAELRNDGDLSSLLLSAVDILRYNLHIPGFKDAISTVRRIGDKHHALLPKQQAACREMILQCLTSLRTQAIEWNSMQKRRKAYAAEQEETATALVKLRHKIDSAKNRLIPRPPKLTPPRHMFARVASNGTKTDAHESECERIRQGLVVDEERLQMLQAGASAEEERIQSIRRALAARERAVAGIVDALRSYLLSLLAQTAAQNAAPPPIKPRTTHYEYEEDEWEEPLEVRLEPGQPVLCRQFQPMLPKGARTRSSKQTPQPSADNTIRVVREGPTYTQIIVGINGQMNNGD